MALVVDQSDGSNHGMFSKAGRHTIEKYTILSKKEEILHNKKKSYDLKNKVDDDDEEEEEEENIKSHRQS